MINFPHCQSQTILIDSVKRPGLSREDPPLSLALQLPFCWREITTLPAVVRQHEKYCDYSKPQRPKKANWMIERVILSSPSVLSILLSSRSLLAVTAVASGREPRGVGGLRQNSFCLSRQTRLASWTRVFLFLCRDQHECHGDSSETSDAPLLSQLFRAQDTRCSHDCHRCLIFHFQPF